MYIYNHTYIYIYTGIHSDDDDDEEDDEDDEDDDDDAGVSDGGGHELRSAQAE